MLPRTRRGNGSVLRLPSGGGLLAPAGPEGVARLARWLDGLRELFAERILSIGDAEASRWSDLAGQTELPVIEGLIAATALVHDLTLVTCNLRDFALTGVRVLDPWQDA
jgi:hypothetical protein